MVTCCWALRDGQVIDVGRVVGPAGATGERGQLACLVSDGVDGEAVLSGPRAPTQDDGKNGDHVDRLQLRRTLVF